MDEELVLVATMISHLKLMVSNILLTLNGPVPVICSVLRHSLIVTYLLSTGKHGHGVTPNDRFEKAYYEKHPELIKKEVEQYHERPAWAMSSDDLNKIVRDTASRASGIGKTSLALRVRCWKSWQLF